MARPRRRAIPQGKSGFAAPRHPRSHTSNRASGPASEFPRSSPGPNSPGQPLHPKGFVSSWVVGAQLYVPAVGFRISYPFRTIDDRTSQDPLTGEFFSHSGELFPAYRGGLLPGGKVGPENVPGVCATRAPVSRIWLPHHTSPMSHPAFVPENILLQYIPSGVSSLLRLLQHPSLIIFGTALHAPSSRPTQRSSLTSWLYHCASQTRPSCVRFCMVPQLRRSSIVSSDLSRILRMIPVVTFKSLGAKPAPSGLEHLALREDFE